MGKKNPTPIEFVKRARELRKIINNADYHYYVLSKPVMLDKEYDKLYYELMLLERDFPNLRSTSSPTQRVGSDLIDGFEKSTHERPMLSMDKIKAEDFREGSALRSFISKTKNRFGYTGQWKCDGLTLVLTYKKGKLVKAVTRGNGYIGDDVTINAKTIRNLPLEIDYHVDAVIRGEAMISKKDFAEINSAMIEANLEPYANARNLASGSLKSKDPHVCRERRLMFFAYDVISCTISEDVNDRILNPYLRMDMDNIENDEFWLNFLKGMRFSVVPWVHIKSFKDFQKYIDDIEFDMDTLPYAIDGAIFKCNDYVVRRTVGEGNKYPNWAFAYKFEDDVYETKLLDIEWDVSRTRRINPVAIFEPLIIDGTTVDRATLNNPEYIKELELGIGDTIGVIKANMIIPNVVENYTRSNTYKFPKRCPVCGGETKTKGSYLYCKNTKCYGANLRRFNHFCSKGAMDVRGLSNSKLFDLLENDVVSEYYHLYDGTIEKHRSEIVRMDGWGPQSYRNLINGIEESRSMSIPRFIYGLGIPNIGYESACVISDIIMNELSELLNLTYDDVIKYDGFGDKTTRILIKWIQSKRIIRIVNHFIELEKEGKIVFESEGIDVESDVLNGMVFCITGKLSQTRDFFAEDIIKHGGEYTKDIRKNTTHLLYGDDAGSKLSKAKDKGLVLVTEAEYNKLIGR